MGVVSGSTCSSFAAGLWLPFYCDCFSIRTGIGCCGRLDNIENYGRRYRNYGKYGNRASERDKEGEGVATDLQYGSISEAVT